VAQPFSNDPSANGGFDFKYGITRGLTADMTVNTDFAQVEEDVQQVNLTRFSLFFPERRDFFLEGLGNFGFAGQGTGSNQDGVAEVPTLFFSRRIGLNNGATIPVRLGGRVTGRARGFEIGLLNIQTGEKPEARTKGTNFTAARVRRQVLRRSNIGFITTMRSPGSRGTESFAGGVDANFRFYDNIENNFYYASASDPRPGASDTGTYRARVAWVPDRYGIEVEHLKIGKDFAPEVGFVRRPDYRNSSLALRFSPRLKKHKHIRQFIATYNLDNITNSADTQLENRNNQIDFAVDFHNSDRITVSYVDQYEFIPAPFTISPGVRIPRDTFNYETYRVSYVLGNQRKVAGTLSAQTGTLYNGDRTTASYGGRLSFSPRFVMEPTISFNRVHLPYGDFTANLLQTRVIVTPQPRMQIVSLLQWNQSAKTLTSSVRLRWEYIPGSDFFVVFTDGRNTPDALAAHGLLAFTPLQLFPQHVVVAPASGRQEAHAAARARYADDVAGAEHVARLAVIGHQRVLAVVRERMHLDGGRGGDDDRAVRQRVRRDWCEDDRVDDRMHDRATGCQVVGGGARRARDDQAVGLHARDEHT
jgi:hypothetical protein